MFDAMIRCKRLNCFPHLNDNGIIRAAPLPFVFITEEQFIQESINRLSIGKSNEVIHTKIEKLTALDEPLMAVDGKSLRLQEEESARHVTEKLYGRHRKRCGARTRRGTDCACKVVPGKHRCPLHGGLSTGPKSRGAL